MKRIVLLTILALEGISGILGGILLIIEPSGSIMKMQVEIMHGVFSNFLIPGIILTGLGILTLAAFVALFCKSPFAWLLVYLALVGFAIWFIVEIVILREINWLHIVWGGPVLIGLGEAFPLVRRVSFKHGGE